MYAHPVKKTLGLTALYFIIIIGIFVLQFRSESVISKSIGLLRYTLVKTDAKGKTPGLKNSLKISFRGLILKMDNETPAVITRTGKDTEQHITLISYTDASPSSCTFTFSDKVSLTCSVTGTSDNPGLILQAEMPEDIESVTIPYTTSKGYTFNSKRPGQAVIETKDRKFTALASNITDTAITLTNAKPSLAYTVLNENKSFSYDTVSSLALAGSEVYTQTVKKFNDTLTAAFTSAVQNNTTITEKSVIAYVAAMSENGQFIQAINSVPDSFKKGTKRTFLSAPYFDTLAKMHPSLQMQMDNFRSMVSTALDKKTCDVFAFSMLSDYMLQNSTSANVRSLLQMASSLSDTDYSIDAVYGILTVYAQLSAAGSPLADILSPAADKTLQIIAQQCTLDNGRIVLTAKDTPISVPQAVETGAALVRYGSVKKDDRYTACGRLIINSYLTDMSSLDLFALSDIYPSLNTDNTYYPHFALLSRDGQKTVWAWTCASSVQYTDNGGTSTITIDFPQGFTHYLYICGIDPFIRIQIYEMDFRTDPRFETYNSSGYVYLSDSHTLLLKSRHKSQLETVRLFHN